MPKRLTTKEFINKANKIHNNKYDYSKVKYVNAKTKVAIICPIHGEFEQVAHYHLTGNGCQKCKVERIRSKLGLTTDDFIRKARKVHGDKYDYSLTNYINTRTKVTIICPKHGKFKQIPNDHLQGHGCRKCYNEKHSRTRRKPIEKFIEQARRVHCDKYDYSKVKYVNNKNNIIIICPEHGEFEQQVLNHLHGKGCPKCGVKKRANSKRVTTKEFLERANKIHNNKYDYSKVKYNKLGDKVEIICPEHGSFFQKACNHLQGQGCPRCIKIISKYEDEIAEFIKNNITNNIIRNSRKIISPYELDIYLPSYKIAIEFNGSYWHSMDKKQFDYHQMKFNLCKEKGIYLIHVFEEDYQKFRDDIFEEIKCCCGKI